MNNLTYFIIVTVFIFTSCRKETEKEVKEIDSTTEINCYNDEFDAHELGLDCGGEFCEPCEVTPAPCNNQDNQLYIATAAGYEQKSITSIEVDTIGLGKINIQAYLDNSTLNVFEISFSERPDITKVYKGVSIYGLLEEGEVSVNFDHWNYGNYSGTGDVYVSYENGTYTIESCDYSFSAYNQNSLPGQWFKLSFDI